MVLMADSTPHSEVVCGLELSGGCLHACRNSSTVSYGVVFRIA